MIKYILYIHTVKAGDVKIKVTYRHTFYCLFPVPNASMTSPVHIFCIISPKVEYMYIKLIS